MFHGLSAFPITPLTHDCASIDESAYARLVKRLAAAGVDSIGGLGSTGGYAYLSRQERKRALQIAVAEAGDVPIIAGIGALRTDDVLRHADEAQGAGVSAVLLAPMSYTPMTTDEVFGLYKDVTANLSVPLCVHDYPAGTRFTFTDEMFQRVGTLPHVGAIKAQLEAPRIARLSRALPADVTVGVDGDHLAADGLIAGADAWYSVIAGIFPEIARDITNAASSGDAETARQISQRLDPIWALLRQHGGLRVMTAAAELLGLSTSNLPCPLRPLDNATRQDLGRAIGDLGLEG